MASLLKEIEQRRARARLRGGVRSRGGAPKGTGGGRSYRVEGAPKGARVRVTVPARFFGKWKFVVIYPGARDLRATARVYCGTDHRLKFEWSTNPGAGVMRVLEDAANRAIADLGGSRNICK